MSHGYLNLSLSQAFEERTLSQNRYSKFLNLSSMGNRFLALAIGALFVSCSCRLSLGPRIVSPKRSFQVPTRDKTRDFTRDDKIFCLSCHLSLLSPHQSSRLARPHYQTFQPFHQIHQKVMMKGSIKYLLACVALFGAPIVTEAFVTPTTISSPFFARQGRITSRKPNQPPSLRVHATSFISLENDKESMDIAYGRARTVLATLAIILVLIPDKTKQQQYRIF